eukprot:581773-Rhodomonas_salina.2
MRAGISALVSELGERCLIRYGETLLENNKYRCPCPTKFSRVLCSWFPAVSLACAAGFVHESGRSGDADGVGLRIRAQIRGAGVGGGGGVQLAAHRRATAPLVPPAG